MSNNTNWIAVFALILGFMIIPEIAAADTAGTIGLLLH